MYLGYLSFLESETNTATNVAIVGTINFSAIIDGTN